MATILNTYDFKKPSDLTITERRSYPWEEWLDGNIWKLTFGEDFVTNPLMMERIIRTRVTARKAKITLRHVDAKTGNPALQGMGVIILRRSDIDQPAPRPVSKKRAAKPAPPAKKPRPTRAELRERAAAKALATAGPSKKVSGRAQVSA